ncbi:fibrous sheath-interacting protein 1 isoform X2 [Pelobates fuscus]|uniref:fibrous sheath-interacting protein 1 isoform X2 n=1 Tax=Pelobates fuscus TaxID=191477 RepID=UPI002FE4E83F
MNIIKGELDFDCKAAVSKSRPGSRISSSRYEDKPRINPVTGSLEVLTPELVSQMQFCEMKVSSDDGRGTPGEDRQEDLHGEKMPQRKEYVENSDENISENNTNGDDFEDIFQLPFSPVDITDISRPSIEAQDIQDLRESESPSSTTFDSTSPQDIKKDPNLDKAMEKMKSLDEILQRKIAKEKEVKAQGREMRQRLWEELQLVSKHISVQSNEEILNTNKFFALTPQLNEEEYAVSHQMEEAFESVFSTQIPSEDFDDFEETIQDEVSDIKASDTFTIETSHETNEKKTHSHKKGTNFIQRNIELAKEAGSSLLLMEDEQLRLEQLLADIDNDCDEEDTTGNMSMYLVPREGFTADSEECKHLSIIETELLKFHYVEEPCESSEHEFSTIKNANVEPAPGEKVLNDTKMLREQKLRLREIDHQIKEIQRNISSLSAPSSVCGE